MRLRMRMLPTLPGLALAPSTATESGRKIGSREWRTADMAAPLNFAVAVVGRAGLLGLVVPLRPVAVVVVLGLLRGGQPGEGALDRRPGQDNEDDDLVGHGHEGEA